MTTTSKQTTGILVSKPVGDIMVWSNEELGKPEDAKEPSLTGTGEMSSQGSEGELRRLAEESGEVDNAGNSPQETKEIEEEEEENKRRVQFTTIEIRDYPIIVGDNPAVSIGVPITIDWVHDGEFTSSVDEYEKYRPPSRSMVELKVPRPMRESLLRRLEFSRKDILEGTKAANIARHRRTRTRETMALAPLQEFLQRASRATMNATVRRAIKQKEKEWLLSYSGPVKSKEERRSCCASTLPMVESSALTL